MNTATAMRLSFVPDARFRELSHVLQHHLQEVAQSVTAHNFGSVLDELMKHMLAFNFREAGADEGSIWIVDHKDHKLHAAYNSGPHKEFVGKFSHDLGSGLLSMVFATERPFIQNSMDAKTGDGSVDAALKLQTSAMIATPLYFLDECRGVVSCIKLKKGDEHASHFTEADHSRIRYLAATVGRLVELRILRGAVGLHEGHR